MIFSIKLKQIALKLVYQHKEFQKAKTILRRENKNVGTTLTFKL